MRSVRPNGTIDSCAVGEYLTFGQWIYLVPQYKPRTVLILGFAGGTVAGYIRKFYGEDVDIVGVDIDSVVSTYGAEVVQADAFEYIKGCDRYDTIIVDLFKEGSAQPPLQIEGREFVDSVVERCNYLIVHATSQTNMSNYPEDKLLKMLQYDNSRFYYYVIDRVASLPIR